eukprot:TRINITY_DN10908_c0_g1_i1.p2 TRINITY_DN10908_c0_g1~~TRINITY_DN10908_c0_g1_i1.p2  ORF type:complete len:171 (-),score=29.04 TRINITY_DN10908_c0_g1_i1:591-1103(-)
MSEVEEREAKGAEGVLEPEVFVDGALLFSGEVIRGFGRGSKQLGIPTANLDVAKEPRVQDEHFRTGIYLGWATLNRAGPAYPMVMSIGWNPFYHNTQKTMEAHLIHQFPGDFYGEHLRLCVVAYLRPERNFPSLDALIQAIKLDIHSTTVALQRPDLAAASQHPFLYQLD